MQSRGPMRIKTRRKSSMTDYQLQEKLNLHEKLRLEEEADRRHDLLRR